MKTEHLITHVPGWQQVFISFCVYIVQHLITLEMKFIMISYHFVISFDHLFMTFQKLQTQLNTAGQNDVMMSLKISINKKQNIRTVNQGDAKPRVTSW